ncbi:hypothetical protein DFH09DRAFT_1143423 [Mycena vulgaris]|nr:hypothetical protein DFH09DRAFT_1143423 [Mycena vulgaris]
MATAAPVLEGIADQQFYDINLGPFLCGLAAQMFMTGVLTLQMWKYFEDNGKDPWPMKTFVSALFAASIFQSGTDFFIMYDAFVTGYGRIDYWNRYGWTLIYEPAWTACIAALSQGFFLHRCWQVTRSPIVLITGGVGLLVSFGAGIAASAGLVARPYYTETSNIAVQVTTWLIASAVTDIGISIILIKHLRTMKTGFSKEKTLSRIVRLTFETAALTSLIALVDLIVYLVSGKVNCVHLAFQLVIGKMYNHSVMVTLLARARIRSEFDSTSAGRVGATDSISGNRGTPGGITVTRTQIRITDVAYPMKSMTPTEAEGVEIDFDTPKIGNTV